MGITEAYVGLHRAPAEPMTWGELVSEHTKAKEYQTILTEVPLWGQRLLLDLQGHHPDSFEHSLRVATMVSEILLDEQRRKREGQDLLEMVPDHQIILSALLHDVGKKELSNRILNSSGTPTSEEWGQIQRHPGIGFEVVRPHDLIVAQIVGGHHMHQGKRSYGYPGGEDVSRDITAARTLVAAADVADALGSRRTYKPEISAERARAIMMGEGNFQTKLIDKVINARFYGAVPFATSIPPGKILG